MTNYLLTSQNRKFRKFRNLGIRLFREVRNSKLLRDSGSRAEVDRATTGDVSGEASPHVIPSTTHQARSQHMISMLPRRSLEDLTTISDQKDHEHTTGSCVSQEIEDGVSGEVEMVVTSGVQP